MSRSLQRNRPDLQLVLREVGLGEHFSLGEFLGAVEVGLGRPVQVASWSLPPEFTALWVRAAGQDVFLVAAGVPQLLYQVGVAHEGAHALLGHVPAVDVHGDSWRAALALPVGVQALARGRVRCATTDEAAAEALATLVCVRLCVVETPDKSLCAVRFRQFLT